VVIRIKYSYIVILLILIGDVLVAKRLTLAQLRAKQEKNYTRFLKSCELIKLHHRLIKKEIKLKEKKLRQRGPSPGFTKPDQDSLENFIRVVLTIGKFYSPSDVAKLVLKEGYELSGSKEGNFFSATCGLAMRGMDDIDYDPEHRGIYILQRRTKNLTRRTLRRFAGNQRKVVLSAYSS
jgi:hypothetical protein